MVLTQNFVLKYYESDSEITYGIYRLGHYTLKQTFLVFIDEVFKTNAKTTDMARPCPIKVIYST